MLYMYLKIFINKFKHSFLRNKTITFKYPKTIEGYRLWKILPKNYQHRSFKYAIYKKNGKKSFAKIWSYPYKNFDYYSLINESRIYEAFSKIGKQIKFQTHIPKKFILKEEENTLILLIEYIEGKTIENIDIKNKIQIYQILMRDLKKITNLSKYPLIIKVHLSLLIIYIPVLLLISFFRFPKYWKLYLRSLLFLISNITLLLNSYKSTYVHRSLEDQNIILKGKKIYLIDFQLGISSHPYHEIAQTLMFNWNKKDFVKELLETERFKKIVSNNKKKNLLSLIAIYVGLHHIAIGFEYKALCFSYLKYMVNIQKEQKSLYEKLSFFIFKLASYFKDKNKNSVILCYHSIGNDGWRFSTNIDNFKEQIIHLKKNYKIVSLSEILQNKKERYAAITFDDGYENVYTNAFPILKKMNIKASIFVIGDKENANRIELDNKLPLMDIKQIKELKRNGWEIGYHTNTHADLSKISDEKLRKEIISSKILTEKKLGFNMKYFAYPRGIYNNRVLNIIKKAGYKAAFTINGGILRTENPYLITRIPMEGRIPIDAFKGSISKLGIRLTRLFMEVLVVKQKLAVKISYAFKK